ncbi:LOW QUALITY PROTEIN: hypothetical protein MAR_012770 [Mya arenaria]|uniref:Uncharacterized protein n=1 Tax=Mya arenaria TaxID=6604 RepID=A0ABY7G225_MYAAR|nr:LOW QUALITY PROTEIN: hypothetical protein MAR_012770 [Mya arenaria]
MRDNISIIVNVCLVMFVVLLIVGYTQWIPSIASENRKTPNYKVIQNEGRSKGIPMNTSSSPKVTYSLSSIAQYDLKILLIVYNRAKSMLRLLNSINEANFDGDNIKLEMWIDRSKTGDVDSLTVETAERFVFKHGYSSQTLEDPEDCLVFLYPVLGTWGFSPKRDNWIHFLEWFSKVNQDKTFQPYIPGNVMTEWFKTFQSQGKAGHKGLTANWMEAGLHFAKSANKPTNDLLTEWESDYENLPDQPKHLDLKGWDPSIDTGNRKTPIYKVIQNQGMIMMKPINTSSSQTGPSSLSPITQYDLRIMLIVYNRAKFMLRLLNSINEANFDGDSVKLEVWIDRYKTGDGHYEVIKHSQHVRIYGQWLATWKPLANSSEIAMILEDDITPYIRRPRRLFSILVPHPRNMGFSPSRESWIHFKEWFSQVNRDKKSAIRSRKCDYRVAFQTKGKADGMWSIWHFYQSWKCMEYTLYANFEDITTTE